MSSAADGVSPAEARRRKQRWINIAVYVVIIILVVASRWYAARQEAAKPVKSHSKAKATSPGEDSGTSENSPADSDESGKAKRKNPAASARAKTAKRDSGGRFSKSDPTTEEDAEEEDSATSTAKPTPGTLVMKNVVCRDEDGEEIFRGDVDLAPTLARIDRGETLRFSHDGVVFENREGRLPRKASGYYHEWVQPTEGERGPGPQRIITGQQGEAWYSSDHYRTFKRIR